MTKDTFLDILKQGLNDFPEGKLSDILYDYKEHFDIGFASGKSDDEIINELGNPYDIVDRYRNGYLKKYQAPLNEENINNEEDLKYKNAYNSKQNHSDLNYHDQYAHESKKRSSNNFIITLIIIILSLILFGPITLGITGTIFAIIISLIVTTLSISVVGIGILLGKVATNTIGIFIFPSFILDFPNSVIAFTVAGSSLLFIFLILSLYYVIKLCVILIKRLVNWISSKIKEEK
jgi:uncharacterized membrane protein